MDETLAVEHFGQRFELQIAAEGQRIFALRGGDIFLRGAKTIADNFFHAHARLRITRGETFAPVRLLDVFAQREFHALRRVGEFHFFRQRAPAEFHDLVLSADRIGRAVEQIRTRQAAGQLAINLDVSRIDHIADAHFAGHRVRAFIHAATDGGVRMAIDDAGRDVQTFAIDNGGAARALSNRDRPR